MRNQLRTPLLAIVLSGLCNLCPAQVLNLYVSPDGDDSWSGLFIKPLADPATGPLRTLEGARDRLRRMRAEGSLPNERVISIELLAGDYVLDQPFLLESEDSGDNDTLIAFTGRNGSARVFGSRPVPAWAPVTEATILQRLPEEAREHVLQADLSPLGITNYGSAEGGGLSLFFNGRPMTLARWPNEGFTTIVELTGGEPVDIRGTKGDKIGRWTYDGDRPSRWVAERDAWLHGYWFWDWSDQRHKVKSIDPATQTVEVAAPYHGYGYRKGQWYYAYNLLSEIDTPGEWYLDRGSGVIYFWPPSNPAEGDSRVTVLDELVRLNGASHVEFNGIHFEGARKTAITIEGGRKSDINGCTIRNIGGDAVIVRGGEQHAVWGSEFSQLGGGAISLSGGDRATLTPAGHEAKHNHIHDYGQWFRMYHAAVSIRGVGIRVANNHIHDAPHMAVYFDGNDHVIQGNEIHHVCLESNDAGAIYAGRDWTMRGTVISNNFLHNITGFRDKGCVGVYLDDMFCGTRIEGNLFYRVTRAAFIGGGRDVAVKNNVFIDCNPAFYADNRAQNWAADTVPTTMMERLNAMPYTNPLWKGRYPELPGILQDDAPAPKGNIIARNVSIGGRWDEFSAETAAYLTFDDNLILGDEHLPKITDGSRPAAAELVNALEKLDLPDGFEPLPIDEMGNRRP